MALDFFAGCVGGAGGVLVGYPLDTVKVRIQTGQPGRYRGTFHCLAQIVQAEGVRGLYRGMSSPLAGVAAINAITFGVYGNVLRRMENPGSVGSVMAAGATAGLIQTLVVSPMELVKTQMQVGGQTSISGTMRTIMAKAGPFGLTRGLGVTFTREVPAFAAYFGAYELIVREYGDSNLVVIVGGGVAGVLSWLVTYPQDVIKSRLQADQFGSGQKYRGPLHCLRVSWQSEGPLFLTRGLGSTVIRAFPMNAATFYIYNLVMKSCAGLFDGRGASATAAAAAGQLCDKLGSSGLDSLTSSSNSWSRRRCERLTTITTDMPTILLVQQPASISQERMYPEQMLYACPDTLQEARHHDSSFFFRENFNQFNQLLLEETLLPTVIPPIRIEECHEAPHRPSLLSQMPDDLHARWRNCITTSDLFLPINLLSSVNKDRIYGFYYLVA